jgi:hypothetical protein
MIETRRAITTEEKEAVYRFRYSVYVEEMGRYQATADHVRKRLVDTEDDRSWNYFAHDGREVVASNRITWGPQGFSARQIEQYGLAPFLAELPATMLAVGERTMVGAAHRGSTVGAELANGMEFPVPDDQIRVVFGVCEPHLISYYARLGSVPYANRNVNSDAAGYVVPLVSFPLGVDALRNSGGALPSCVQAVVDNDCAITSSVLLGADAYWQRIGDSLRSLEHQSSSLFDTFTSDEIQQCVARSNVIQCAVDDRIVKQGSTAHSVFVVLEGALEARDGTRVVGALRRGDVFGETAFLLEQPRTLDVVTVEPDTRVLCLSERVLRNATAGDAVLAAKLYANLSRLLCRRAVHARQ